MNGQTAVFEEASQSDPRIPRVPECYGSGRLVEATPGLGVAPGEEGVEHRLGFGVAGLSRSWGGAVAHLRSTAKSPPMKASASRARSGSLVKALNQYLRACQQATSTVPCLYR